MIKELCSEYSVRALCAVLGVSRSGYYGWCRGRASARAVANQGLVEQIARVFRQKRGRYGSPRVTAQGSPAAMASITAPHQPWPPGLYHPERARPTGGAEPIAGAGRPEPT